MTLIISLIWIAIFMSGGIWSNNNDWEILSYVSFAFAGLSLIYPLKILNLSRNKVQYINTNLEDNVVKQVFQINCQNCKISEPYPDMNIRKDAKMYSSDVLYTKKDGTHVRPFLCFNCNYVSEYQGGIPPEQIDYLNSYELNKAMKNKFLDYARSYAHEHAINKIKKIKLKEGNGCFPIIVFCILGICLVTFFNYTQGGQCSSESNDCNDSQVCEYATEIIDKEVVWSTANKSHTETAKSRGLDCNLGFKY